MNNFNYYYLPTMPNNKLSHLLLVIDSLPVFESVAIVVKNAQQASELDAFLKTKAIESIILQEKNTIQFHSGNVGNIFIVVYDDIALLKDVMISQVISIFSSISVDELKKKVSLCHLSQKFVLIELIAKFDFQFIQSLYKFSEIIIERFSLLENDKMIENRSLRAVNFLKKGFSGDMIISNSTALSESIDTILNSCDISNLKLFFKSFINLAVFAKIPTFDFNQIQNKLTKEFKIVFELGYLDSIVENSLREYFCKIPGMIAEAISECKVEDKKTALTIQIKDLNKSDIVNYLMQNDYLGMKLTAESITEKIVDDLKKQFESGASQEGGYKNNNFVKRDRERGDRFNRRQKDGDYYQKSDRGGYSHKFDREDRGGRYQKRDNNFGRGGYDKYKNHSHSENNEFNNFSDKESFREQRSNNYNKGNYNNDATNYEDNKKSFRSFSSDVSFNDGYSKDKEFGGQRKRDSRGGDRWNRDRKSDGGRYKKSFDKFSSQGNFSHYSKDRYDKRNSNVKSHNNEEVDFDNE